MNTTDLTRNLIRYRFTRNGMMMGCSAGEAALIAESQMKAQGLYGLLAKLKLLGTPEGALVTMVETYLTTFVREMKRRPEHLKAQSTSAAQAWFEHCRVVSASTVEEFRARVMPGELRYPNVLRDYIAYRLSLETRQRLHIDPAEMGLDEDTILFMADEATKILKPVVIAKLQ